jgi:hypothetical protein
MSGEPGTPTGGTRRDISSDDPKHSEPVTRPTVDYRHAERYCWNFEYIAGPRNHFRHQKSKGFR